MRILTILLLPLLFVATSCDSGGEGSACAVDPTGTWKFTQVALDFSEECCAGDTACSSDLVSISNTILESLDCVEVFINAGYVLTDREECDDCTRGIECEDVSSYSCSDNIITSDGDVWLIIGNTATTASVQTIDDFISEFEELNLNADDYGIGCTVTSGVSLTRQ